MRHATLVAAAGSGDVLGLKEKQPGLWQEAQRVLVPLAATQRAEARVWERDHHPWVRRRLGRTQEGAGWMDWRHLRQVWLVRTERFVRQTTPRADRVPVGVEAHYDLTHLDGKRLEGKDMLGLVRSHWSLANHGFRTLELAGQEEQAWWTPGAATAVLGLLRLWAYNGVGRLKGRYLRASRYRRLTLGGFVAWRERVSAWGEARRRRHQGVPVG